MGKKTEILDYRILEKVLFSPVYIASAKIKKVTSVT